MKRILIAPLDWGLGHATRCIPIIRGLKEKGAEPVIAGDGRSLQLLRLEFPELEFIPLPGYQMTYPSQGSLALHVLRSIPAFLRSIKQENAAVEKIVEERSIHAVISDNRYGAYSSKVPSVFITHQLFIRTPVGERVIGRLNRKFINRFSECWIPDVKGEESLSGELSQKKEGGNTWFIGPLSRFCNETIPSLKKYDLVVSLSGPEPQRSEFEKELRIQLDGFKGKALLLQGTPETNKREQKGSMTIVSHLPLSEMNAALAGTAVWLCRSGYSSIMDAAILGKKCIFVPTPGQTEQEYLAAYHGEKGHAIVMKQKRMILDDAMETVRNIPGFEKKMYSQAMLNQRLSRLLSL